MKSDKVRNERKRKKVANVVELSESETVYIKLDNGKKYFLNADGCWRCGSTAHCFGNMMDNNELEVICEFDFFDEVRSLFLILLQDRVIVLVNLLREKISDKSCRLIESLTDIVGRVVDCVNVKKK